MAGLGAFTTDELLAWLGGVKPTVPTKTNVLRVAPAGAVAYNMRLREEEALRQSAHHQEDEEEDPAVPYEPHYNLSPDDEESFDLVDEMIPGRPTNPAAKPGDYDYAVDQSTDLYEMFPFKENSCPRLPIHSYREEILGQIGAEQVSHYNRSFFLCTLQSHASPSTNQPRPNPSPRTNPRASMSI